MIAQHTDISLPAILDHIERQRLRADIVTLTRGQIFALLNQLPADRQPSFLTDPRSQHA